MATKLFVAGLAYSMTDEELKNLFTDFGAVTSTQIITDRSTNQSKGFGFVEMENEAESKKAIEGLNGKDIGGRPLTVNLARPREDRPVRSFNNRRDNGNNFHRSR